MSTPENRPSQPEDSADPSGTGPQRVPDNDGTDVGGQQTTRDDVTDDLPLPNEPKDATGLLSADDLNGEAPD